MALILHMRRTVCGVEVIYVNFTLLGYTRKKMTAISKLDLVTSFYLQVLYQAEPLRDYVDHLNLVLESND